jgi:hypothetical protein
MAGSVMRKSTGLRRTASGRSVGRSNGSSSHKRRYPYFAICIENHGNEGSLWVGKVYQVIRPEKFDGPRDLRVIDEEGEDYLYSNKQFVVVELPTKAKRVLTAIAN